MDANTTQPEPLTIESVQAQLEAEKAAHDVTKNALTALSDEHETLYSALQQNKAELAAAVQQKSDLAEAAKIIDGQKQTITDLETRIADLQTSPSEFPTIVVDKVTYEVQAKVIKFKGADYTVAQLLKDKALQKELVKLGAGFLVKKEG